jgi:hypothetical protein
MIELREREFATLLTMKGIIIKFQNLKEFHYAHFLSTAVSSFQVEATA